MNPLYFGTASRRLFGVYAPAHAGGASRRGVVLCYPWGQEYVRAYRSMRHLATLLTRAGVHVLRFDYHGTGDSAGHVDGTDVCGWQRDIELAIEELQDTAGLASVGIVGLRLGGMLAAAVAGKRRDVDSLVLWDPVVKGGEYLDELRRDASHESQPGGSREVSGFPLTEAMAREVGPLDLIAQVPSLPARTLVVASRELPSHGALRQAVGRRAGSITFETIPSIVPWVEERSTGVGAIPVGVVQRIVDWCR